MRFEAALPVDRAAVYAAMGMARQPADAATRAAVEDACARVERAAEPRWVWRRFGLEPPARLKEPGLALPGKNIAAHLAGCTACLVLAVTLGGGVERAIRAAEATGMDRAVLLDAAASALTEQYADAAEAALRGEAAERGEYLTGRYSPGYGDLPLALQAPLLALLDAQKAIGLTVGGGGILLPRKSITALLGAAGHPVAGALAGCAGCALNGKCAYQREGKRCGKQVD